MYAIVAGRRVVTAVEFMEAAGFEPLPVFEPSTPQDIAVQREVLAIVIEDLAAVAASEDDRLDVAHYRQLLRRLPVPFRGRDAVRRPQPRLAVAA